MNFDKETQLRIFRVAASREEGEITNEMDERIAQVMDLHPEFDAIWKQGELAAHPQEIDGQIVNPFVHTVLHVIIDKQLREGDPEFVPVHFERLKKQGMTDHDCLHALISVYADIHFANFRQGKPFDTLDYQSRLASLSYEDAAESED